MKPTSGVLTAVVALLLVTVAGMVILVITGHADAAPSISAVTVPVIGLMLLGQGQRNTQEKLEEVHQVVNSQATHLADVAAATIADQAATITAQRDELAGE